MENQSLNVEKRPLEIDFSAFSGELDLVPIKYKLMREKGWTAERADRTEKQYRAFLFLALRQNGLSLVPSLDIDEMWHAHILDTRKYMSDCARFLGEYLHHYPYLGLENEADAERARHLFEATCQKLDGLGVDMETVNAADCGGCSGGSCSSDGGSDGGGHGGDSGTGDHGSGHNSNDSGWGYSSCSSDDRSKDRKKKNDRSPPRPEPRRRGIISRILGLSPLAMKKRWYASVDPEMFHREQFRPDQSAVESLSERKPSIH